MFSILPNFPFVTAVILICALGIVHAAEIQIILGGPGKLQFTPSSVTASPGDVVTFIFKQSNHTVTQSTFQSPCAMAPGGFDSGFFPIADSNTNGPFPAAQFNVTSIDPVWVYCRQANHCQQGMVFAINPGNQFAAFQAKAMGSATNVSSFSSATAPPEMSTTPVASPPETSSAVQTTAPASPSTTVGTASASVTLSGATPTAPSSVSSTTSTSFSADHTVVVGGRNILSFMPSNITAQVGDTITFQFRQKNHTLTQSTFADPCVSLTETSTSGQIGFDSGFMPVADNATTFPTLTIQINDTTPIWAFCKQANHCGSGMVFSVNALESSANTFAAFQARAKQLNGTSTTNITETSSAGSRTAEVWTAAYAGVVTAVLSFVLELAI